MTSIVNRPRESPWRAVPMDEADECIRKVALPKNTEKISFSCDMIGRVMAEIIVAPTDRPETHTSIKDGYAVRAAHGMADRNVVGVSTAGTLHLNELQAGECVRISTGAVVPPGADAVIQVEDTVIVESDGDVELKISIKTPIKEGQDIRLPGSEVRKGDILLQVGRVLGSAEIGILAAFGRTEIEVFKKPTVAIFSTGNELISYSHPSNSVAPGMIRDSNSPQLNALLKEYNFDTKVCEILKDEPDVIEKALRNCETDLIVTTGGVSMGEKDHMKHVLQDKLQMKIEFGRVWMKPGLPCTLAHGTIDGKRRVVLALPGNPVSAWVCAHLFVLPLLRIMSGNPRSHPQKIPVQMATEIKLGPRPEYCRAWLEYKEDEDLPLAHVTGNQISSRLTSLVGAHVLLILPSNEKTKVLKEKSRVLAFMISNSLSN